MDRIIIKKHSDTPDDPEELNGKFHAMRQRSEPLPLKSIHEITSVGYWNDLVTWDLQRAFHEGPFSYYLHADGEWRTSTKSDQGWTGYFNTKEELIAALQKVGIIKYEDWTMIDWGHPETYPTSLKEKMHKNECDGNKNS